MPHTIHHYVALMRLDRPVGTLLLLWPTLAALWLAADGLPPLPLIAVFAFGTLLMRSAGCVVNDIADRDWDRHVARTAARPLTTGKVSVREAIVLFAVLSLAALALLLFLNPPTRWLAVGGFGVAVLYPFMKRWTHLPQLVLGAAFSWGLLMAYTAVRGHLPSEAWLLFVASVAWIVAYDTLYAMVDRDDDLRVGIRSTAILFGRGDRLAIGLLQAGALVALARFGSIREFGTFYHLGLLGMASSFAWQHWLVRERERAGCLEAFLNNVWAGFSLFAGVVLETQLAAGLAGSALDTGAAG